MKEILNLWNHEHCNFFWAICLNIADYKKTRNKSLKYKLTQMITVTIYQWFENSPRAGGSSSDCYCALHWACLWLRVQICMFSSRKNDLSFCILPNYQFQNQQILKCFMLCTQIQTEILSVCLFLFFLSLVLLDNDIGIKNSIKYENSCLIETLNQYKDKLK